MYVIKVNNSNLFVEDRMSKYVRVIDGTKSNAGGFEYKLDKVNIAKLWDPKTMEPDKMVDLILQPKIKF